MLSFAYVSHVHLCIGCTCFRLGGAPAPEKLRSASVRLSMVSTSKWLEGSSSRSMLCGTNAKHASATRAFSPPLHSRSHSQSHSQSQSQSHSHGCSHGHSHSRGCSHGHSRSRCCSHGHSVTVKVGGHSVHGHSVHGHSVHGHSVHGHSQSQSQWMVTQSQSKWMVTVCMVTVSHSHSHGMVVTVTVHGHSQSHSHSHGRHNHSAWSQAESQSQSQCMVSQSQSQSQSAVLRRHAFPPDPLRTPSPQVADLPNRLLPAKAEGTHDRARLRYRQLWIGHPPASEAANTNGTAPSVSAAANTGGASRHGSVSGAPPDL
eukprot:378741-Pyramimonas_sp.AAC.3